MFIKYLEPLLNFMRKNLYEPVGTVDNNIACSFLRMMDCWVFCYFDTELKKVSVEEIEEFESMVEAYFIFSAVWSIGCTTDTEGRNKFSQKLREVMGKDNKFKFPNQGTCYDYMFNKDTKEWVIWTET
jgi:dynein heavy chain